MRTHSLPLLAALSSLLAACASTGPLEPPAGRLPVFIESVETLQLESFPVQLMLHVTGELPNPCTFPVWNVTAPEQPDDPIRVELYAESDGSEVCITVLEPFDVNIPLGAASGDVRIVLNGEPVTELTLP